MREPLFQLGDSGRTMSRMPFGGFAVLDIARPLRPQSEGALSKKAICFLDSPTRNNLSVNDQPNQKRQLRRLGLGDFERAFYIHLNPVTAKTVDDPADYEWSGHRELLGKTRKPICDVDEVLRVFGKSRQAARSAYVRSTKGALAEPWVGEEPERLPWWRLGRPPASEDDDPETAVRVKRAQEGEGPDWRPPIKPGEFVAQAATLLGVDVQDLQSRRRSVELVRAREKTVWVGAERYALKVKDLAWGLRKSPSGMSQALARVAQERAVDKELRAELLRIDAAIAASAPPHHSIG